MYLNKQIQLHKQIYYFPIKSPSPLHPVFAGVGLAGVVVVPEEERGLHFIYNIATEARLS